MKNEFLILIFILICAIFIFTNMRKQKRAQQALKEKFSHLKPGDRVMTTSGIYGSVTENLGETFKIEIAPGVVTEWTKLAIGEIKPKDDIDPTEITQY